MGVRERERRGEREKGEKWEGEVMKDGRGRRRGRGGVWMDGMDHSTSLPYTLGEDGFAWVRCLNLWWRQLPLQRGV
jgi:hypothetical protein